MPRVSSQSYNIRKEKVSCNCFRDSRPQFSDSLNGQHWIFLRKGLDDFRDGFPPSPDNMIVYGKKRPVSIILKNDTVNSSHTAPGNNIKKYTRIQIFKDVAGVLDPEIVFRSKADYEQENQAPQEAQDHMLDKKMEVARCKALVHRKESCKKPCTSLSKKIAAREKKDLQGDPAPLDKYIKQITKHFCDWVMSLGGGNWNIDKDALESLLSTSCEKEDPLPSPVCAAKLDVQAQQSRNREISPSKITVRSSHCLGCPPCQVKEIEAAQLYSTQAFKEFLERRGYQNPRFLLKMLAGESDNAAQEKTSKNFKKLCPKK